MSRTWIFRDPSDEDERTDNVISESKPLSDLRYLQCYLALSELGALYGFFSAYKAMQLFPEKRANESLHRCQGGDR